MGRKRDEFWQYVDTENGNKCIFCGHRIPGASRIKFHLAQMKGEGIRACNKVPNDVQSAAASTIDNNSSKRVKQSRVSNDSNENIMNSNFPSDSWSSRGKIEGHLLPTTDLVGAQFQRNVKRIWEWLMKDDVSSVMGIWGMGGVGKTTLLKHIYNKLLNHNHNVVWVIVSQNSIHQLQKGIAKSINAHLSDEDHTMKLSATLLDAFKRINKCVIILDDVWSDILLEDMGIPLNDNGIRLIVTSRSFDVCTSMGCGRNIVKVKPLSDEEAWDLFSKNLGDHGTLPSEAIKIAKSLTEECDGLPLAIVTIARSMRGKANIEEWRNAWLKLTSEEKGQDDIKRCVFPVLKSSFDHLNDWTLQHCFLCLPLYSQHRYKRGRLIRKFIDAGLIDGRQKWRAQIEGESILNKLINNGLLDGEMFNRNVSLQGLVRAMAVSIGKESHGYMVMTKLLDEQEWKDDLQKVLLLNHNIIEIPFDMSPRCPKLSTFLMNSSSCLKVIPDNFFAKMLALKILDLSWNTSIEGLPVSISDLERLTVLLLDGCKLLCHIPSLAKLQRLRRLGLSETAITKVPQGFENLTNKDEFNACVQIIQARINSRVLIEGYFLHLQLGDGSSMEMFDYDFENNGDGNGVIRFESVENSTLLLPTNINQLEIFYCHQWKSICDVLSIHRDNNDFHISRCYVFRCDELDFLFCSSGNCILCSSLQGVDELYLGDLDSLSMLCMENQVASPFCPFLSLKRLFISECNGIKTLMTPGMSTQLQNLEKLTVECCESMGEIFSSKRSINEEVDIDIDMIPHFNSMEEIFSLENNNEEEQPNEAEIDEAINLPNLKSVKLEFLGRLNSVCKGTMLCGSLREFIIDHCPELKRVPQTQPPFTITISH